MNRRKGNDAARCLPGVYLIGITAAELCFHFNVRSGVILHYLLLLALIVTTILIRNAENSGTDITLRDPKNSESGETGAMKDGGATGAFFYLTLAVFPFIRIASLSVPLASYPSIYWYFLVGMPVLIAALMVIRLACYRRDDLFLGKLPSLSAGCLQLIIGILGFPLGCVEYQILQPSPLLAPEPTLNQIMLSALILLSFAGFVEELVFRGLLLKAAGDYLGRSQAFIIVSVLFALYHMTYRSPLDLLFVGGVSVFFTFLVYRTGSLWGVSLAHGLANLTLYICCPSFLGL